MKAASARAPANGRSRPEKAKAAPSAGAAAHESAAAADFRARPMLESAPKLQRSCACGGSCPRCTSKEDRIQTKLAIGTVGDAFEKEADWVASRVLAAPAPATAAPAAPAPAAVQRAPQVSPHAERPKAAPEAEEREEEEETPAPARLLPPTLRPEGLTAGGFPLPSSLRSFFEARFGRDFSDVRLHQGNESERLNQGLHARAFTYGSHIWLGRGHAPAADFLLAHELAHVVQQRQPRLLPPPRNAQATPSVPVAASGPAVRRIELGLPFWVPLDGGKPRTGTDIHKEILGNALANNNKLDIEAPAPNAMAKDHGLNYQGSIDLYKGEKGKSPHAVPGLYFDGPVGAKNADVLTTTPARHRQASASGSYHPSVPVGGSGIENIAGAPDKMAFGELKPASKDALDKGKTQLEHYKEGMLDAVRLTNAWAANHGGGTWKLNGADIGLLGTSDVKFDKKYAFKPKSLKDDVDLALSNIIENPLKPGDYITNERFNPAKRGLPAIKGGLYAMPFTKGSGLFMYFARPKNLADVLRMAQGMRNVQGEIVLANQVQDEVINPLLKAPKQVSKLPREGAPAAPPLLLPAPTPESAKVRKAPKAPQHELKDEFNLKDWKAKQAALRAKIHTPKGKEKDQLANLELLEVAYKAEEGLAKVDGAGESTLPDKEKEKAKIVTGKGKDREEKTKPLGGLSGWLTGWTGKPAEILGFFRDKFGSSFVFVANKFVTIKDKIKEKFQGFLKGKAPSSGASKKSVVIFKALGKALLAIAKVLVPRTVRVVMQAIEAGIKKKLAKLLDFDPVEFLGDKFAEPFNDFIKPLADFKDNAEKHVKDTVEEYTKDLGWINDLLALGKIIGPILEGAAIAIQCGSPPGWGCLKLLARRLTDCAIHAASNLCRVQKEIALAVVGLIGPLANLPAFLGQKIMNFLKGAAPRGLEEIFDEKVPGADGMQADEVECETTPADFFCPPGLFPIGGDGGGLFQSDEKKPGDEGKTSEDRKPTPEGTGENKPDPDPKPTYPEGPQPASPQRDENGGGDTNVTGGGGTGKPVPGVKDVPTEGPPQKPSGQPGPDAPTGPGGTADPSAGAGGTPASPGGKGPAPGTLKNEAELKAMQDLLEQLGEDKLGAVGKLAGQAGMPDSAPFTPEHAKRLKDLLKAAGDPSAQDLQDLAAGKAGDDLKKKLKPLQDWLEQLAHSTVLDKTREEFKKGKYVYKFNEMAKKKVHWQLLRPYQAGPFKNWPALMWDENVKAAGAVDGVLGDCVDDGKVTLTITKADMYDEKDQPVQVQTPFTIKDGRVEGGCPGSAAPPPQGKGGGGTGSSDDTGGGGIDVGGGDAGGGGKGGGNQGGASGGTGGGKGGDKGGDQGGGDAGSKGGGKGGDKGGAKGGEGKGEGVKPGTILDAIKGGPNSPPGPNFPTQFDVCSSLLSCPANVWPVRFEEAGPPDTGWFVSPFGDIFDPKHTGSILKPPNKAGILSLSGQNGDGTYDVLLNDDGKTSVVGKVKVSPVDSRWYELISGPLLDNLQSSLKKYLKKKGKTLKSARIHFN